MERAFGTNDEPLPPTRGTSDILNIKKTVNIPLPKSFSQGAKMYVVSACKYNEQNFEFQDSNGKFYGSLSYYLYCSMYKTMKYSCWADGLTSGNTYFEKIFRPFQHPQIHIYK